MDESMGSMPLAGRAEHALHLMHRAHAALDRLERGLLGPRPAEPPKLTGPGSDGGLEGLILSLESAAGGLADRIERLNAAVTGVETKGDRPDADLSLISKFHGLPSSSSPRR
jgi:hypothetical protein